METKYAGPESKTVPMGFTTEYKVKKKNRKGVFSGSKRNWRNISRKLLKASVENVKQEASTKNPNE